MHTLFVPTRSEPQETKAQRLRMWQQVNAIFFIVFYHFKTQSVAQQRLCTFIWSNFYVLHSVPWLGFLQQSNKCQDACLLVSTLVFLTFAIVSV